MDPVAKGVEPVKCAMDKNIRGIDEDEVFHKDWSDDEERRAKRKLVSASSLTTILWMHNTVIDGLPPSLQ